MTKIFIEKSILFKNKVEWFFALLQKNHGADLILIEQKVSDAITVGFDKSDIVLSENFYEKLQKGVFHHNEMMDQGPYILNKLGEVDYISSTFYLINCIQEYGDEDVDNFGRFKFKNSLQYKWNIVKENIVQNYIQDFCKKFNINISPKNEVNEVYLTHDIDFLNAGWKNELVLSLRNINAGSAFQILNDRFINRKGVFNSIHSLISEEHKVNYSSTFFWIPLSGKSSDGILNADYDINSDNVKKLMFLVDKKGSQNGLHKSSLNTALQSEHILSDYYSSINRYHYLKFGLPKGFDDIEESGLMIDSSLGFAEHYGYRNSYGLPFRPFCIKEDKSYNFLEIPLHIMDTTFIKYMKMDKDAISDSIIEWIGKVKKDTLITLLWHNNYFIDYSENKMKLNYIRILRYLNENNIKSKRLDEIYDKYY